MALVGSAIIYLVYLISKVYTAKHPGIGVALISSGFVFMHELFKLEDDLFGLLFVMLAWYFVTRYTESKEPQKTINWNIGLSIFFIVIAGLIWEYAGVFVIAFMLISNWNKIYLGFGLGILVFKFHTFFSQLIPQLKVAENVPIAGLLILGVLLIGYKKILRNRKLEIGFWVFSALTLLNMKFSIVLIPIIVFSITSQHQKLPIRFINSVVIISLLIFGIICYSNLTAAPYKGINELISVGQ